MIREYNTNILAADLASKLPSYTRAYIIAASPDDELFTICFPYIKSILWTDNKTTYGNRIVNKITTNTPNAIIIRIPSTGLNAICLRNPSTGTVLIYKHYSNQRPVEFTAVKL